MVTTANVERDKEKLDLSHVAIVKVNGIASPVNSWSVSLQTKHTLPYDPGIILLGIYLREENLCPHKNM